MRRPPLRRLQDRRTERQCRPFVAPGLSLVPAEAAPSVEPAAAGPAPRGLWLSGHIGPARRAYPDAPGQVA